MVAKEELCGELFEWRFWNGESESIADIMRNFKFDAKYMVENAVKCNSDKVFCFDINRVTSEQEINCVVGSRNKKEALKVVEKVYEKEALKIAEEEISNRHIDPYFDKVLKTITFINAEYVKEHPEVLVEVDKNNAKEPWRSFDCTGYDD